MNHNYIEQMMASDQRFLDRVMVFTALRERRAHLFPRRLIASLLWILGAR